MVHRQGACLLAQLVKESGLPGKPTGPGEGLCLPGGGGGAGRAASLRHGCLRRGPGTGGLSSATPLLPSAAQNLHSG